MFGLKRPLTKEISINYRECKLDFFIFCRVYIILFSRMPKGGQALLRKRKLKECDMLESFGSRIISEAKRSKISLNDLVDYLNKNW